MSGTGCCTARPARDSAIRPEMPGSERRGEWRGVRDLATTWPNFCPSTDACGDQLTRPPGSWARLRSLRVGQQPTGTICFLYYSSTSSLWASNTKNREPNRIYQEPNEIYRNQKIRFSVRYLVLRNQIYRRIFGSVPQ